VGRFRGRSSGESCSGGLGAAGLGMKGNGRGLPGAADGVGGEGGGESCCLGGGRVKEKVSVGGDGGERRGAVPLSATPLDAGALDVGRVRFLPNVRGGRQPPRLPLRRPPGSPSRRSAVMPGWSVDAILEASSFDTLLWPLPQEGLAQKPIAL